MRTWKLTANAGIIVVDGVNGDRHGNRKGDEVSVALYYYTLTVLLASILTSAVCLSVYLVNRQKPYLFTTFAFLVYFFDVALVLRTDVVGRKSGKLAVYEINGPVESALLGSCLVLFFWCACREYLGLDRRKRALWAIPLSFLGVSYASFNFLGVGKWREFAFFSVRSLFILALLIAILVHFLKTDDLGERRRLLRHRGFYLAVLGATVATTAWNVVFILGLDYSNSRPGDLSFLPERNFAENALLLCIASFVCVSAYKTLRMRYVDPPAGVTNQREAFVFQSIASYSNVNGLSRREEEVLRLVLDGKDNRAIADELFISVSTVKVHVHNILHKTSMGNRKQLTQAFWSKI